jgi:Tol biopolymer transport system component
MGGTYFVTDGDLKKFNLKTKEMDNSATYPRWHPSGYFVAFSSNKVVQQFHSSESKKIEVSDLASSLVLYDLAKNEIMNIPVNPDKHYMDTYPEWSPTGDYLYFCRAAQIGKEYDYRDTKYNLCRVKFNLSNRTFGEVELVFDASAQGKSVSFPRISPDGKMLVFTLHDYGCFPIWHKEADLYSVKMEDFSVDKLDVNSDFTESYHSWSANGKWLVFSSKRGDGLSARPYISFVDEMGVAQKPFVLPQEDPKFYSRFLKTFNIPEFAETDFSFSPGEIRKAARSIAIQPKWSDN